MRKKDELSDPSSCLNRARYDEWTFVLLGRDEAAPMAVAAWIEARVACGKNKRDDPQIQEAEAWIQSVLLEQMIVKELGVPAEIAAEVSSHVL